MLELLACIGCFVVAALCWNDATMLSQLALVPLHREIAVCRRWACLWATAAVLLAGHLTMRLGWL